MTSIEAHLWLGLALVVVGLVFAGIGGACGESRENKALAGPMFGLGGTVLCMGAIAWIKALLMWLGV